MCAFRASRLDVVNRYSLPGVSSICRLKASRAAAVIGMSPMPLTVLESAM
jgi:hypothetical protein